MSIGQFYSLVPAGDVGSYWNRSDRKLPPPQLGLLKTFQELRMRKVVGVILNEPKRFR